MLYCKFLLVSFVIELPDVYLAAVVGDFIRGPDHDQDPT